MNEPVFPQFRAHCATLSGCNLIFAPGTNVPLSVSEAAIDFARYCAGKSINEAKKWLLDKHGEASVCIADEFRRIVEGGHFAEPDIPAVDTDVDPADIKNVDISVTHACNLRCRYCFGATIRDSGRPQDMSADTVRATVDFIFGTLEPPWVSISLGTTGEPQLRWSLVKEAMDYARDRSEETGVGVGFLVTTNGAQAGDELLGMLRTHGDVNVALSWDGPQDIHDQQRPNSEGAGTYQGVSRSFEALSRIIEDRASVVEVSRSQPGPTVNMVVSALNLDIRRGFAHLFDKGVRQLVMKTPRAAADPDVVVTESNLEAFKAGYESFAELLLQPDLAQTERLFAIMTEHDGLGRYILRICRNEPAVCRCTAARTQLAIDTNGDIYPCPSLINLSDFRMGNVRTGLNENKRRAFHEKTFVPSIKACSDCWARHFCGGPCPYVSSLLHGRPDVPHKPDCDLTRYLVELAGFIVARLRCERPGLLEHVLALREVDFELKEAPTAICQRQSEQNLIGGPPETWKVANPIVLADTEHIGGPKRWGGPQDCSARIHLKWDAQNFYIMAEVVDDRFVPPASSQSEWYFGDSIQFAFDPECDGGEHAHPWKLPNGDYEFAAAWVDGESRLYDCQSDPTLPIEDGYVMVARTDNVTTYRIAVPWKRIPGVVQSAGAECGFSVVVNDCDGGARGWLQWGGGLAVKKVPSRFGLIRLVE